MTDRDTFAAAALTGILSQCAAEDRDRAETASLAYRHADAMLRERKPSPRPSGVAEAYATAKQISDAQDFVRDREEFEAWKRSRPVFVSESGKETPVSYEKSDEKRVDWNTAGDKSREASTPTGSTLDVDEVHKELIDVYRMTSVSGDIRDTCRDAAAAIERLRAWVNELQLSRAEIDALQHVVEDGRFVDLGDYGRLRSLLVRLRPEWGQEPDEPDRSQPVKDAESDRSQPVSDERLAALEELSALDQKLELEYGLTGNPLIKAQPRKAAKTGTTQPRNGTPANGSVPRSGTENEPAAWAVKGAEYDTGCEYEYVSLVKESADAAAKEGGTVTPLYRAPTLTDEEREAVEWCFEMVRIHATDCDEEIAALRKLLERLK